MGKNNYEGLSDQELMKRRNVLIIVSIVFGILFTASISIIVYLLFLKGFKDTAPILVPVLIMPITTVPLLINLISVNKEVKARKL